VRHGNPVLCAKSAEIERGLLHKNSLHHKR
jgi:hypothetical protein